jgi:hypothetical protein
LKVGDVTIGERGEKGWIESIEFADMPTVVFNISVDQHHTYSISGIHCNFSVWVHNENICDLLANMLTLNREGLQVLREAIKDGIQYQLGHLTPSEIADLNKDFHLSA